MATACVDNVGCQGIELSVGHITRRRACCKIHVGNYSAAAPCTKPSEFPAALHRGEGEATAGVGSDRPFALKPTSVKSHTRRKGALRQGCRLLNCTSALYRKCVSSNIGQTEILAHTSNHGWLKVLGERENGRFR